MANVRLQMGALAEVGARFKPQSRRWQHASRLCASGANSLQLSLPNTSVVHQVLASVSWRTEVTHMTCAKQTNLGIGDSCPHSLGAGDDGPQNSRSLLSWREPIRRHHGRSDHHELDCRKLTPPLDTRVPQTLPSCGERRRVASSASLPYAALTCLLQGERFRASAVYS